MLDVYFYECFEEEERALRAIQHPSLKCGYTWRTIQEAHDQAPPARLICIRTQSSVPIAWASQIEGVLSRSQGHDHLIAFQRSAGVFVPCGYLEEYCSRSVAEHAVMAMFVLMRKLKKQVRQFDIFERDGITGRACSAKEAVVVGVGHIGRHIADICRGLRMNVSGVDIRPQNDIVPYVDLDTGIRIADVLFCAAPLTDRTVGMLDHSLLKKAKPGLLLINIARGEITPAQDMKDLLDEGVLGGLSLDVFPYEKELAQHLRGAKELTDRGGRIIMELSRRDNVLFTPHNAFNTEESVSAKARLSKESIRAFFDGQGFLWSVQAEKEGDRTV